LKGKKTKRTGEGDHSARFGTAVGVNPRREPCPQRGENGPKGGGGSLPPRGRVFYSRSLNTKKGE